MKKRRRALAGLLALTLATGALTACGSGGTEAAGSGTAANTGNSGDGLKVALADSYNGNTWRQTEENCFTAAAEDLKSQGIVSEYSILCSDQDVTTQISQINSLILDGYDVIVVCPTSTTALSDVIDEAADAGITVITCIDGIVETDSCYQYDQNSPGFFGVGAEEICKLAKKGDKVVVSRGIVGLATEQLSYEAELEQIEKYGLDVVGEVESQWTDSVGKEALAQTLPSLDWDVDVIIGQGGDDLTAIELFEEQNKDIPLVLGQNRGNFLKWWANAYEEDGYEAFSCGASPQDSGLSLYIAADIASGKVEISDENKIMSAVGCFVDQDYLEDHLDEFKKMDDDAIFYDERDYNWIVDNVYSEYASSYNG